MTYEKKGELCQGKTKVLWEVKDNPDLVIVENKADITAFDDPSYTKQFAAKAKYATSTTCRVFELLKDCGVPVAYVKQISETEFLAPKVEMIPLECIARRLAVGSYLKRRPDNATKEGQKPKRFHRLVFEIFLKTGGGGILKKNEQIIVDGLPKDENDKQVEDPYMEIPNDNPECKLYHPKKPLWDSSAYLNKTVDFTQIMMPANTNPAADIAPITPDQSLETSKQYLQELEKLTRQVFLILENAWSQSGYLLVDFKLEFGWTAEGKLVVADVIDNDSWRLRDPEFQEISKQVFRDGKPLDEVEAKYGHVADLVSRFRLPKQGLVIWRGSDSDNFPELPGYDLVKQDMIPGVKKVEVTMSAHKKTNLALIKLEEVQREFPDGGVVIAEVGMSNGLGPVMAAHTSWPVISRPADESFPEDVWSSLRTPSKNPMATILSPKNAVLYALNILAQKNPAVYMMRRYEIEELDTDY